MRRCLLYLAISVLGAACAGHSQDSELQDVLNGARLLFVQSDTLFYMEIGQWGKIFLYSPCDNGSTVRWAASGKCALIATPSSVTVINVDTKQVSYSKTGLSINNDPSADPAADISYDGNTVYFAQGNNIKAIDLSSDQVSTVYTTSSANQITEGELCVSGNGKRFAGRQSNDYAVFIDIEKKLEGQYAEECSPAISPSGTILAVNQDGHQNIKTFTWELDADAPVEWRIINIAGKGKWDNQTWSNHENYYVGNGDGGACKIVNVQTEDVYNFGHSTVCLYPDLWVPASVGGIVPASAATGAPARSALLPEKKNRQLFCNFSSNTSTRITAKPGISRITLYSLTGRKIAQHRIRTSNRPQPVTIAPEHAGSSLYIVKQLP